MKIEVISTYYREEFLAPLFMLHYEPWVDRITLLTDKFPDGKFDDGIKAGWINAAIARSDADWVVVVDFDEFVFPLPLGTDPRTILANEPAGMIYAQMVRVWKHRTEQEIDRMAPPVWQRRHGEPDHDKPCIFRPKGVRMGIGNHSYESDAPLVVGQPWSGVHWANADASFWTTRGPRDRGQRLSQNNLNCGHGTHTLKTVEQIIAECNAHLDDPAVIQL